MSVRTVTNRVRRFWAGFPIVALLLLAPSAQADFSLTFGNSLQSGGSFSRQAGAHPDYTTRLEFEGDESVRRTVVDLPPGMVGNATVTDRCTLAEIVGPNNTANAPECLSTSRIGSVAIEAQPHDPKPVESALYNMVPPANLPALFAFNYQGVIVRLEPHLRPSDYGVETVVSEISDAQKIKASTITFWGIPAEDSHHRMGYQQGIEDPFFAISDPSPRLPFFTNPTSCPESPISFGARIESWQGGTDSETVSSDMEGTPFQIEGCEHLAFEPSASVVPGAHRAAEPTGLEVNLRVPQNQDPDGLATANVRKTTITLPQGFALSPAAAHEQAGCSPAQIGLGTNDPPTCPVASRLGSVSVKTPLIEGELGGEAILAKQDDNPFGSLLAMYVVVKGPGILVKLPGKIEADPQSGRLTASFENLPQLPFEEFRVNLRGGPTAPLVAPSACGTYQAKVQMTSWASAVPVDLEAPMAVTEGCDTGGFNPGLHAGTSSPVGGSFSPFDLQVTRENGEANLSRIEATLPEGLLAKLKGVPLCGDAAAADGACPATTQVGRTTIGTGAGPSPLYVPEAGKAPTAVYLAGPYKGAPYSLVVKVPAQAGPFDLGTVTVRNALNIDPATAQVTALSDPLPQILEGIPLSYRDVRVEINRPEFTLNPTSCDPMKVTSMLTSISGQTASPSTRFQASGCGELGFKPSLRLALKGSTKRTGNPAVTAVLKFPAGGSQANVDKTAVLLPPTEFIDNAHINNPCTRVQFNAGACPKASILGTARAYTPLLDQPLEGPVYFRSNGGERELPDLVADLGGQIHITLVGFIDSVPMKGSEKSRLRTRFQNVPDAPVSKFVLKLKGGKKGLIENSVDLCRSAGRATVKMDAQNGKVHDFGTAVANSCGGKRGR